MTGFVIRTAFALAISAGLAFASTAPALAADDKKPEKTDITFGIIPTVGYAPIQLAIKRGFFKEEGLSVKIRITPPGASVPALLGGAIDVSGVNWIAAFVAYNRNIPIKVIAVAESGTPGYVAILVKNDSPVRDLKGLLGKKLGAPSAPPGTCDVLIAHAMGKKHDQTGINFTSLPVPQMMPTLARGDVDAICLPEPFLSAVLQKKEARVVFDPYGGDTAGLPIVSYTVSAAFAKANPNTVAALQRAIAKGEKLAASDPAAVREILPSFLRVSAAQAKAVTLPKYITDGENEQIARLAKILGDIGALPKPVKIPSVGNP